MGGKRSLDREGKRNVPLKRAERGREGAEGSVEGRYSGKGVKGAGRGRRRAGREDTKKAASRERRGLGWGVGLVSSVGRVGHLSQLGAQGLGVGVGCRGLCRALSVPR